MKTKIFSSLVVKTLLAVLCFGILQVATAQDAFPVYAELSTWKYTDDSRELIVLATTENENGDEVFAKGLEFIFYVTRDGELIKLGEAMSDESGKARFTINAGENLPKDEEYYVNVIASFEGNESYEAAEAELAFKDVIINLSFVEEDETKYISFSGRIIDDQGKMLALADDDLYFFVSRMFSFLKIAEGWFEENGEGMVEYPTHIIGDSLGNLEVHARILDHFDYGNVEKISTINWAVPSHLLAAEQPSRELWTPIAPLWMIITLIILLAGVWGHYMYAMYELYMIRKIGKREQKVKVK